MKILVVDDSATMRKIFRDELESAGYEVIEAENGKIALEKIADSLPIDLITLDIDMPGMNGFEVCEKIFSDEYLKLFADRKSSIAPVIFITANDTLDVRKKGFEIGGSDFIVKPFIKGDLLSAANKILKPVVELEGLTALVVDDSITARFNISKALELNGVNIMEAENGAQAFEIMSEQMETVDIMIVDLMMPKMNGDVLCKKVRNELDLKDIPIIFLTAICDQTELLNLFNVGGTDYLVKPFAKEELLARITVHLDRAKLTRKLRRTVDSLNKEMLEHKHAKDEIKKLNYQLKSRVVERTEELESIQKEIIKREYKSELSDITSITLENVNDVLGTVKNSTDVLGQLFNGKAIRGIRQSNKVLKNHIDRIEEFICYDPKGKSLMHHYLDLEDVLNDEMDKAVTHMERLSKKVVAIEKMISAQKAYSSGYTLVEDIQVSELIDDALTMQSALIESYGIDVIKKIAGALQVKGLKTKLMHVLMNLIENAKEAMEEKSQGSRVLTLTASADKLSVNISISDTGNGIPAENIDKIFSSGFTTKQEKEGAGLYNCENYINGMEGTIRAQSPGEGMGATFVLTIPMSKS